MQRLILLLVLVTLSSACGGRAQASFDEARSTWTEADIDSYEFVFLRHCECDAAWAGPWRVTVIDGAITEFAHEQGIEPDAGARPLTINELFAKAQAAITNHPNNHTLVYDERFGFPSSIQSDLEAMAVDGGESTEVRDFIAR